MQRRSWWRWVLVLGGIPGAMVAQSVVSSSPVVHAVLFYSPTCPHCHQVMNVDLPPLLRRFGSQLNIVGINASTSSGGAIYEATARHFNLPPSRLGVPALVIGTRVLVGSQEIPDELPGIVERGLLTGGIDWPAVPAIRNIIAREAASASQGTAGTPQAPAAPPPGAAVARADAGSPADRAPSEREPARDANATAPGTAPPATSAKKADAAPASRGVGNPAPAAAREPGVIEPIARPGADTAVALLAADAPADSVVGSMTALFLLDPVGNGASVVVLAAMLGALFLVLRAVLGRRVPLPVTAPWVIPVLCAIGFGVASYLAVVEVTGARAVCGPVGDCNTVQQSEYARLFGVIPVGTLGMTGYVAMAALWFLGRRGPARVRRVSRLGAWAAALLGTVFSAYLTFLEPFVIGASCAWCLSSALIVTLLLLVLTPAARLDLASLGSRSEEMVV